MNPADQRVHDRLIHPQGGVGLLGLYLSCDVVVHRHNGSVDATSVPGNTRLSARLPLARQAVVIEDY